MDGKTFTNRRTLSNDDVDRWIVIFIGVDYQVGVTAPSFHWWCRTVIVPYFDDNTGFRAAKGAEGKIYYVPDKMSFGDRKKMFVDVGAKDGLNEITSPYWHVD